MAIHPPRRTALARIAVAFTAIAALSGVALVASPAGAITVTNTYYVGTTADNDTSHSASTCESPTNTVCSLRWDVEQADDDGSGYVDTIKFSVHAGAVVTLSETNGEIEADGDETLTIDGAGPTSTLISGGHVTQVFYTDMEYLTIENLTVENGWSETEGAGVENVYDLALKQVNFANNNQPLNSGDGGAVYSDYSLTVTGGTYSHNNSEDCGGAMDIRDDATVSHALFVGNSSDCGGAIYTGSGDVSLSDNTYVGNTSRDYDDGGALQIDGEASVLNSTFVGNVSSEYGGAIAFENDGDGTVQNNTMVDNWALQGGGGFANDNGDVTLSGNILTGNTELTGGPGSGVLGQCVDYGTGFADGGGNVLGPDNDPDCGFNKGSDRLNANVQLGALANNGGATPTIAITDTSVAAHNVPVAICPVTDQRGQLRGGNCSAGAYQVEPKGSATTCKSLSGSVSTTVTFKSCTNKGNLNTSVGGSGALLIGGGQMTWKPSHLKSTISISVTDVGANPCGGGFTTEKILGIVTASSSPGALYFDRVSAEVCEAAGSEDVSLFHGTTAKI